MNKRLKALGGSRRATVLLMATVAFAAFATTALAANLSGDGTIVGTSGNDNITAGNGDDTVFGLGGSDTINAGYGNDQIDAGGKCPPGLKSGVYPHGLPNGEYCEHGPQKPCGPDHISIAGGGQNGGNDIVYGNCGQNSISFGKGQGNDIVYGYGGPNTINVSNGNDKIYLNVESAGSNLTTGNGTDVVYAQNGFVDTINCGSRNTVVYADRQDKTSNCTVKFTSPSRDARRRVLKKNTHKKHRVKRHLRAKR